MRALVQEKQKATELRKKGMCYRDILKEVNVAKSSLSLWLKDLPLTKNEKYALKQRKNGNISRGRIKAAGVLSEKRLERESIWLEEARQVFTENSTEPFFHIGISLYWAEGAKRSNQWSFINSDDEMNHVMLKWAEQFLNVSRKSIRFRLYIHKLYAHENCELWWQTKLNIQAEQFSRTIYKPSGRGIKKRPQYKGCLRFDLPRSKGLLMKMKFWQSMQVEYSSKQ
jgi:hypothetical protein